MAPAGAQSSPHGSSPDAQSDHQAQFPSPRNVPRDPDQDVWSLIAKAGAAHLAQMDHAPRIKEDNPAGQPPEAAADSIMTEAAGKRPLAGEAGGTHVSKRLRVSPEPGKGTVDGGQAHAHTLDTIPDSEDPQQQLPWPSMHRPHSAEIRGQHRSADMQHPEHPVLEPSRPAQGGHQGGQEENPQHPARLQFKSTSKLKGRRTSGAAAAESEGGSDRSQSSTVPDGCSSPELCRATRSGLPPLKWASAKIVGEPCPPAGICVHGSDHT